MKRKLLLLAAAAVLSGCGERPGVQMQPGLELLFPVIWNCRQKDVTQASLSGL